jgi:hypothetical protein
MKLRKITSLFALLSFVSLVTTSVVLYIVPQGRVAYWADWRLLGLSKTDWGQIHINLGLFFLLAIGLHIYYNWKPIVAYLKDKSRQLRVFTAEFNMALALTAVVVAGTYWGLPPFSWVLDLNDSIKETAARHYGEPPYGHAELSSLQSFAKKTGLDLADSVQNLQQAGYRVDSEKQTLAEIARINRVPPQKIYQAMQPVQNMTEGLLQAKPIMPKSPPPGTGNLTLDDVCSRYGLPSEWVMAKLKDHNVDGSAQMTIKKIAADNRMSPIDIYDMIRKFAEAKLKE